MKVRLTAEMLRLRLDQPDVDALSASGAVGFVLPLGPDGALPCALRVDATADAIGAVFSDDGLVVTLPANRAARWISSDAISLEGHVDAGPSSTRILIEKDLGCRHPGKAADAAESQAFDHLRE